MKQIDISLTQGDDWNGLTFRWREADLSPIDIVTARMQIRTSPLGSVLVDLDQDDGLDVEGNEVTIVGLTSDVTIDLLSGVWDIVVTSTAGEQRYLAGGRIIVRKAVTR